MFNQFSKEDAASLKSFAKFLYDRECSNLNLSEAEAPVDVIFEKNKDYINVAGCTLFYGQGSFLNKILFSDQTLKTLRPVDCAKQIFLGYRDGYEMDRFGLESDAQKLFFARLALKNGKTEIYDYTNLGTNEFIEVSKLLREGNSKEEIAKIMENGNTSIDDEIKKYEIDEYGINGNDEDIDLGDLDDFLGI